MNNNVSNFFNIYGYSDNIGYIPKIYEVKVSKEDNIISINKEDELIASIKLKVDDNILSLIGKDDKAFSTIELPLSSTITNIAYSSDKQALIITVHSSDGSDNTIEIPIDDILNEYAKKEDVEKNSQAIEDEASIRETADQAFAQKDAEIEKLLGQKVEWTDISTEDSPNRKSIVLENHDTILGKDTNGNSNNLIMLSKWDVIDVGSSEKPINLNTPKGVRPTIQEKGQTGEDAYQIAYTSDIKNGVYNLGEVESFNNLDEASSAKGICDSQDNVVLTFKITASTGKESGFIVNVRYGDKISQALYWKQSLKPEMYRTLTIDSEGNIDNPPFYPYDNEQKLYIDTLPSQSIFTLTTDASNETIQTALTDVLGDKTPITDKQLDECLKYGYYILESSMRVPVYVGWNGNSYTLTMVGLPSPNGNPVIGTVAIAIKDGVYSITKNGSRSTIVTASNIDKNTSIINLQTNEKLLLSRIEVLESKLNDLSKTNIENVILTPDSEDNLNDSSKDYIIEGELTKSMNIVGKSVKLDDVSITNNSRTDIKAKDVEVKGVTLSGDFPKVDGNCPFKINDAEYIVIRNMTFDSNNIYNGLEIGLNSSVLPKSILIEDCKFIGQFSNNAILIFGTQDNAVININNCYFESVSNPIRLSNNTNVHCTLNISNCQIDKWEIKSPYQGMILFQDYTSENADNANANNLFAPEKIIVNIINTIGPNNKKVTMPSNIADVCGTGNDKQLFYIWDNYRQVVPYEAEKYPTFNIL